MIERQDKDQAHGSSSNPPHTWACVSSRASSRPAASSTEGGAAPTALGRPAATADVCIIGRASKQASKKGANGWQTFWYVTLPNIKWGLFYGVILCNARAMGEFGAVSVVSGHIRGLTNTMPLHVEILYNEYNFVAAFAVSTLLAGLALVTLVLKTFLEYRYGDEIAAAAKH